MEGLSVEIVATRKNCHIFPLIFFFCGNFSGIIKDTEIMQDNTFFPKNLQVAYRVNPRFNGLIGDKVCPLDRKSVKSQIS
jgi:hypothetical protein